MHRPSKTILVPRYMSFLIIYLIYTCQGCGAVTFLVGSGSGSGSREAFRLRLRVKLFDGSGSGQNLLAPAAPTPAPAPMLKSS